MTELWFESERCVSCGGEREAIDVTWVTQHSLKDVVLIYARSSIWDEDRKRKRVRGMLEAWIMMYLRNINKDKMIKQRVRREKSRTHSKAKSDFVKRIWKIVSDVYMFNVQRFKFLATILPLISIQSVSFAWFATWKRWTSTSAGFHLS